MSAHSIVVIDNAHAAPHVRLLTVTRPDGWAFAPGQVAELATTPGTEGYFAMANAPSEGRDLQFLIKAGDSDSAPLMRLEPGDSLSLRGPFGAGFSLPHERAPLLFVAAGTALGAIRSAIVEALACGFDQIGVVIGLRRSNDLCFGDDVGAWRARGVLVRISLSRAESADAPPALAARVLHEGRVQAHLDDLATPDVHVFIAGSEEFEDEVTEVLVRHGAKLAHIQRNYRPDARAALGSLDRR